MKTTLILSLSILINFLAYAEDDDLREGNWDFLFNPYSLNLDFKTYDQQNAIICGKLSYLAYYSKEDVKYAESQFQKYYPSNQVRIGFFEVKKSGTQLIMFGCNKYVIIAFRGTEFSKIKDIVTDAKYKRYRQMESYDTIWKNLLPGHAGFRKASKSLIDAELIDSLKSFISEFTESDLSITTFPIFTTGHSLGAGIAQMFINPLRFENLNYSGTYTFATPLAVSSETTDPNVKEFKESCNHLIHNIVNYRDYVSRAGVTIGKGSLAHVGNYYRICLDTREIVQTNPIAIRFFHGKKRFLKKYHTIVNILNYLQYTINTTELIAERTKNMCICKEDEEFGNLLVPINP